MLSLNACKIRFKIPTFLIEYDLLGDTGTMGIGGQVSSIAHVTSADWYNLKQFEALYEDFMRARPSNDMSYIRQYGRRKCEANAIFKNDETLTAGKRICRNAIEKYYGEDALERFGAKESAERGKLSDIYDSPIWDSLKGRLDQFIRSYDQEKPKYRDIGHIREEITVEVDNEYYGLCPECGNSFDYDYEKDIGKVVVCRRCRASLWIKAKTRKLL